MPTLSPGCQRVPRWRTIMLPARADWPPNNLTPRRLLSLSRPLRELPPAFLCAIVNYFALGGLDFVALSPAPLAGAAFFVDALAAGDFDGAPLPRPGLGRGLCLIVGGGFPLRAHRL